jgi:hypothetical protein
MVAGISGATLEYILYRLGILRFASPMASNIWTAVWGFAAGLVVTVVLSLTTAPPDESKLKGLVYSRQRVEKDSTPWFRTPAFWAAVVIALFVILNVAFA